MKLKDVETIFKNEKYYRNVIKTHFLESGSVENLGIQCNNIENSNEKSLIKKMENKRYLEAKMYVEAIDDMVLSEREKLVFYYRYKHRFSVERISRELHFSIPTIWNDLKLIKNKFIKIIEIRRYNW